MDTMTGSQLQIKEVQLRHASKRDTCWLLLHKERTNQANQTALLLFVVG